jgi:hypothetical protein
LLALLVFHSTSWSPTEKDSSTALFSLLLGILLLGAAIALVLRKPRRHESALPLESLLKAATLGKAFLAGVGVMLISPAIGSSSFSARSRFKTQGLARSRKRSWWSFSSQ